MAERKRRDDLSWDDQQTPDNEAPAAAPDPTDEVRGRGRRALRDMGGPDHLDCRWSPSREGRGWLSIRDPSTGERWEVASKYVEGAPWREVEHGAPAPQEWVRRAMDKLPPRPRRPRP